VEVDLYSTTALEMILVDYCDNACRIGEEGDSCHIRFYQPFDLVVATAPQIPSRALIDVGVALTITNYSAQALLVLRRRRRGLLKRKTYIASRL
jgi:hypothetical protein